MLEGALDKLIGLARPRRGDSTRLTTGPLRLDEYQAALETITSSRGKAIRRLVYDTFLRFFMGATNQLEWANTVSMMGGGTKHELPSERGSTHDGTNPTHH